LRLPTAAVSWLSPNRRGLLTIIGGTALGQLIGLLGAPVLSRIYSPNDFGVFAIVLAMATTIGAVASSRFELAVPLPERESDAYSLVFLGLTSCALTAGLGIVSVALFGDTIASSFAQEGLRPWLWMVGPTAAFMGWYMVLNQLAIRRLRYGAIGRRSVLQTTSMTLTQIALGLEHVRPGGMVFGLATGQMLGATSLSFGSGLRSADAREGRTPSRLREVARRYRRFPLLLAPSGLLNILGTQLPVLLLAYFYGIAVAGWMGLAQRVLAVPVTLLGTTVAQVYLAELARSKRSRFSTAGSLFTRASRSLLTVGALVGLVLLIGGPQLFALVFGQEWAISGKYAQAMSLGLTAQFIGTPLSQTLIVYERQMLQLSWDTARLVLVSTAIVVASATGTSALGAVWALSLASALAYSLSWLLSWRVIRGLSEIATGTGKLSGSSSAATPGGEDPVEGS
jgi:O-antigen/teichoic acid export membrane protein